MFGWLFEAMLRSIGRMERAQFARTHSAHTPCASTGEDDQARMASNPNEPRTKPSGENKQTTSKTPMGTPENPGAGIADKEKNEVQTREGGECSRDEQPLYKKTAGKRWNKMEASIWDDAGVVLGLLQAVRVSREKNAEIVCKKQIRVWNARVWLASRVDKAQSEAEMMKSKLMARRRSGRRKADQNLARRTSADRTAPGLRSIRASLVRHLLHPCFEARLDQRGH